MRILGSSVNSSSDDLLSGSLAYRRPPTMEKEVVIRPVDEAMLKTSQSQASLRSLTRRMRPFSPVDAAQGRLLAASRPTSRLTESEPLTVK